MEHHGNMFSNVFNIRGEPLVATRLVPCLDAIKNASDDVVAARSLVALPFEKAATLNMDRMVKTMKENGTSNERNVSCWKQANTVLFISFNASHNAS